MKASADDWALCGGTSCDSWFCGGSLSSAGSPFCESWSDTPSGLVSEGRGTSFVENLPEIGSASTKKTQETGTLDAPNFGQDVFC